VLAPDPVLEETIGLVEIQVRRATPDDAIPLAAVEVASWRAAYRGLMPEAFLGRLTVEDKAAQWRRTLLKHAAAGRKRVLAAHVDERLIGFVRVGPEGEEEGVGLVYLLYVLPEYWGRGVGSVLMNAAMDELRDLGLSEAILWVLRGNQRARQFYERLGWRADGRMSCEDYGGVKLDAVCYRRAVSA
jgi:GNAT superfamily N-acetyltransferase